MSQQSINTIDNITIFNSVKESILSVFLRDRLYNNFALGSKVDSDLVDHNSFMYDILRSASCHTIDLVNALQKVNFKKTKYKIKNGSIVIEDNSDILYKIWLSKGNNGSIDDFYNTIVTNNTSNLTIWENVEW